VNIFLNSPSVLIPFTTNTAS